MQMVGELAGSGEQAALARGLLIRFQEILEMHLRSVTACGVNCDWKKPRTSKWYHLDHSQDFWKRLWCSRGLPVRSRSGIRQ